MTTRQRHTETEGASARGAPSRSRLGSRVLGGVALAIGIFLFREALAAGEITLSGPRLAPVIVTAGWIVLAGIYLLQQFIGATEDGAETLAEFVAEERAEAQAEERAEAQAEERAEAQADEQAEAPTGERAEAPTGERTDAAAEDLVEPSSITWVTPALVVAALLGYVLILEPVGFVLASAVFFVATARILGSHHLLRDTVTAIVLAVTVYFTFTQLLDINLPSGVLPL